MPFSRAQQSEYRPLVDLAWKAHATRHQIPVKDKALRSAWYIGHLRDATGKASTTDCNGGRDFDRACAHFEHLAESGVKFQIRLISGDTRRIRHAIQRTNVQFLRQFASDAALESWLRGIAQQSLSAATPPELHTLDDRQIHVVTRAACIQAARSA